MTRSKLQKKNLKSESKKSILGLDDQGLNNASKKINLQNLLHIMYIQTTIQQKVSYDDLVARPIPNKEV